MLKIDASTSAVLAPDASALLLSALEDRAAADAREIDNLKTGLQTSRRIGAAIGIVMATMKITEDEAFTCLVRASQNRNVKLRVLADDVVRTGSIPA